MTVRGNACILVVEDEALIAMDLQALLEDAGYRVLGPANSSAAALALIDADAPDVALLDVNLGRSDAFGVASILTERKTQVIFLTGHTAHKLPPAHWCRLRDGKLEQQRYWRPRFGGEPASDFAYRAIGQVPHRHGVRLVAEPAVADHRADAPDAPVGEHCFEAREHFRMFNAQGRGDRLVRLCHERESSLRRAHDRLIRGVHATSLNSMKYSCSRGRSSTG